jgi:hypothetical protein
MVEAPPTILVTVFNQLWTVTPPQGVRVTSDQKGQSTSTANTTLDKCNDYCSTWVAAY